MASLRKLVFLISISLLSQHSYCAREKRDISDFIIPGINVGDMSLDFFKEAIFGRPVDKDQLILDKQVEHMEATKQVLSLTKELTKSVADTPELTLLIRNLQQVRQHLDSIEATFKQFEMYKLSNRSGADYRVNKFATDSTSLYSGPLKEIRELYSLVLPPNEDHVVLQKKDYSLLVLLIKHEKGYKQLCDQRRSHQMLLLTIMEFMTIAEIKTFLVTEFSTEKLAETEQIDYKNELDILRENLNDRFKKMIAAFQKALRNISTEVWRCDPKKFIEGENYFRMTVFQKYIARDVELRPDRDTCYYLCEDFSNVPHYGCNGYEKAKSHAASCQKTRRCSGKVHDCVEKFPHYGEIQTCPADANSTRRYEYIHDYMKNKRYGPSIKCKNKLTIDVLTLKGVRQCEVCLCVCDDNPSPRADQKINLRAATADKDHVITGIRWLKKDHTLHLQIQQGKVLAKGRADPATVHWKAIQEPRDKNDIATLNWLVLRGFHLRDFKLSSDSVVAGVKLDLAKRWRYIVTLRLLPVTYEYESGKLRYSKPFYEDPDASVAQGLWTGIPDLSNFQQHYGTLKVPTDTKEPSIPISGDDRFVELSPSDLWSDAGQSTVPFFDMQENVISPPSPLSGMGIYLKQSDDYAGFIALKLLSYDFMPHLTVVLHNSSNVA